MFDMFINEHFASQRENKNGLNTTTIRAFGAAVKKEENVGESNSAALLCK